MLATAASRAGQRDDHAHPSLTATTHEAALATDGRTLNFHG